MDSFTRKLVKTRRTLVRETRVLVTRTRAAGGAFARETEDAGRSFATHLGRQARQWQGYGTAWRSEALRAGRQWVRPRGAGRGALVGLLRALERLQAIVQKQLASLEAAQPTAPLEAYRGMTARQIAVRIRDLSEGDCRRIRDFEQQHKRRATVLKAVEQRLAA